MVKLVDKTRQTLRLQRQVQALQKKRKQLLPHQLSKLLQLQRKKRKMSMSTMIIVKRRRKRLQLPHQLSPSKSPPKVMRQCLATAAAHKLLLQPQLLHHRDLT